MMGLPSRKVFTHNLGHSLISQAMREYYRSLVKDHPAKGLSHFYRSDSRGLFFGADISSASTSIPDYDIVHPVTKKPVKKPTRGWGATEPVMLQRIKEDRVLFGPDETTIPLKKSYLTEVDSIVRTPVIYKDGRGASLVLSNLVGSTVFDNPKDHLILAELIDYATSSKGGIIMDFFAGSASTAHAVNELNRLKNTTFSYIAVQIPEPIHDITTISHGFRSIADIGKARMREVAKQYTKKESGSLPLNDEATPDLGFRVFKLAPSTLRTWQGTAGATPAQYAAQLDWVADSFGAGWQPQDVVWEIAIKEGFPLTSSVTQAVAAGQLVYRVSDSDSGRAIHVCLDDTVTADLDPALGLESGDLLVVRDTALDDTTAANLALQCRLKTI